MTSTTTEVISSFSQAHKICKALLSLHPSTLSFRDNIISMCTLISSLQASSPSHKLLSNIFFSWANSHCWTVSLRGGVRNIAIYSCILLQCCGLYNYDRWFVGSYSRLDISCCVNYICIIFIFVVLHLYQCVYHAMQQITSYCTFQEHDIRPKHMTLWHVEHFSQLKINKSSHVKHNTIFQMSDKHLVCYVTLLDKK